MINDGMMDFDDFTMGETISRSPIIVKVIMLLANYQQVYFYFFYN